MSCEICGRSNCSKSFHSRESVDEFDNIADDVKDRMRNVLISKINRLEPYLVCEDKADVGFVILSKVIDIINEY